MSKRLAVIDVGSNSIKALVAESDGSEFGVRSIWEGTREVRLSTGIAGVDPLLRDTDIKNGAEAVHELYKESLMHGPITDTRIVATSAVRSARNGQVFIEEVRKLTGIAPQVISGQEEADCIAMGVRSDPLVSTNHSNFTVFDLGGGSMEVIRFLDNYVAERVSLPLGSVRLTEMFISNPTEPIPEEESGRLSSYLKEMIQNSGIRLRAPLIGCSGGLTIWRALRAKAIGIPLKDSTPIFTEADVDNLMAEVVHHDVDHRIRVAKIPFQRADIFPVTLITLKVLFELFDTQEIMHSLHNLRYGIAWTFLQD